MSFRSIPVIDISILRDAKRSAVDPDLNLLASQLNQVLAEFGFFYVKNHGVPESLQSELIERSRRFFSEDLATKMQISMEKSGRAWRGYFPPGGELTSGRPDRKEGIYFGRELDSFHPSVQAGLPLHGPNQWPQDADHARLRELVVEYMDSMSALGHLLMEGIALALGLERTYFRARFSSEPTILFRIFNYQKHVWQAEEDEWGVREHTDYGFLTLLRQDDSGGLQVKSRDGSWIDAPPIDGTLVINIGDMLEVWTHGIYKATPHRVRNQGDNDRISLPFFFDPGWETRLEPIDRNLLPQQALARAKAHPSDRWDTLNLRHLPREMTYGEFLWQKVKQVFPDLATDVRRPRA